MRLILLIILSLLSISCGTYTMSSYHDTVENILAITKSGDTIQVPIREFDRRKNYDYYTRFQWNENWYWNNWFNTRYLWNGYYYNRPLFVNRNYYTPSNRIPNRPSYQPRRPTRVRVNVPRGSNAGPRPNTPSRVRTTPNVVGPAPRSTPGKGCAKC